MKKRSVKLSGHNTSVSLEDPFFEALVRMAEAEGVSLNNLVTRIDDERTTDNLSSAIRIAVLVYHQLALREALQQITRMTPLQAEGADASGIAAINSAANKSDEVRGRLSAIVNTKGGR